MRAKLSTFSGFGGPQEVTCGGNALKFYASVRLNIKRVGNVIKGEQVLILLEKVSVDIHCLEKNVMEFMVEVK